MRGWCKASEKYEPFKQVRSLVSLPRMLALLCGETQKDPRSGTISGALGEVRTHGSMHSWYVHYNCSALMSYISLYLSSTVIRAALTLVLA